MSSTQIPARTVDDSNGDSKHSALTNATAASVQPRALARSAENSFSKSAPEKYLAKKVNQNSQRTKPRPGQTQATHGNIANPSPKKKPGFRTLLKRCFTWASAMKVSEAENASTINQALASIYRLCKRAKVDPDAKEALSQAIKEAGIKTSKNAATEFSAVVKLIFGKDCSRTMVSRYANTLQLALVRKIKSQDFIDFVAKAGGTAQCASLMAKERKIVTDTSEDIEAACARKVKEFLVGAPKIKLSKKVEAPKKGLAELLINVEADGSCSILGCRSVAASAVRSFFSVKAKSPASAERKRR